MRLRLLSAVFLAAPLILFAASGHAQEVCYTDANNNFKKWVATKGKTLSELSTKFKNSKDPAKEMVTYMNMKMPVAAALLIEAEKYGREADQQVTKVVEDAQKCANQTAVVRGIYEFARDILQMKTILPEAATRIDFEEIRRGNLFGGQDSVLNVAGKKAEEILNPLRWKF